MYGCKTVVVAVNVKSKGFPYSLPSVGSGADPGVQTVSLQVTINLPPGGRLPLLSARPAVTFPAAQHHRLLADDKAYCLVTEAHRCEQLAQGCYAALAPSRIWTHDLLITSPMLYPCVCVCELLWHLVASLKREECCVCRAEAVSEDCGRCWSCCCWSDAQVWLVSVTETPHRLFHGQQYQWCTGPGNHSVTCHRRHVFTGFVWATGR